jgi:rsbT antagonist protein RsbS
VTASHPVLSVHGQLLVTLHGDIGDEQAAAFQETVLARIERGGPAGLLVDVSALDVIDTYVARVLVDTARMAGLMGTLTVLVGMRPEVAATLVNMGFRFDGVATALDADHGLAVLARAQGQRR